MTEKEFVASLKELGIELTNPQLNLLKKYYELLIEWNEKINLTAITIEKDVYLKHFYDSLTMCKVIDLNHISTLCDVGTGAGFPGIILKITFPHLKLTLVDSLNKRTEFLKLVVKELNLEDVEIITSRAEELKTREKYDVVTARAVANLHIILELLTPLAKQYVILMKGDATEELKNTANLYKKLNLKLLSKEEFLLPVESSKRTLLKYEKIAPTSNMYPRRYDQIKKKPL